MRLLAAALLLVASTAVAETPKAHIERLLARYYPANEPGAVVLAEQDGKTVVRTARGLADMELGTPLRPEMKMKIGSISKQFTAAAVLRLVKDGKLALTDPLSKYLTGFPDSVTLEHLLTHTAGVAEYTAFPEYGPVLRQDAKPEEIVALIRQRPLEFAPGARHKYTNSAYFLLGAVVEQAAGEPFHLYLRKAVLDPAGLKETRDDSLTEVIPGRARGYVRDANGIRNAPLYSPTRAYSVGALLSTVDDLSRWNRLFRETLPAAAFTPYKLTDGKPTGYGYGWFLNELEGARVIEHGGDIPGFSSHVLSIPEKKIFVAVLSNDASHDPRAEFVATQIATILLGKPWDPIAVTLSESELDKVVGTYKSAAGVERRVTRDGTRLFIERTGGRKSEILPMGNGRFFYPNSFMTVELMDGTMVLRNRGVEVDRATR